MKSSINERLSRLYFWLEGGSVPIAGKHASLVRSLQGICNFEVRWQRPTGRFGCLFFYADRHTTKGWASKQGKSWS
jgi:hypothetical protein